MALTYADVGAEVAAQGRLDTNDSTISTLVNRWIDMAIQDIHARYDWFWTLDRTIVQTVIDKTDGTVSVASAGTSVTGSSTSFASTDVGSFIQFSGSNDWYKISTYSSSTAITIEIGYNGTTNLSAGTYRIRKFFYTLSAAEKIIDIIQAQTFHKLTCRHFREMDLNVPFSQDTGPARSFCLYGIDSSGNLQFNINPYPDSAINLEIKYKKKAVEGSLVLFPEKWRNVVVDGALSRAWEYVAMGNPTFDKNVIRIKQSDFQAGITRMLQDAEPESDYQVVLRSSEAPMSIRVPRLPSGLSIPLG